EDEVGRSSAVRGPSGRAGREEAKPMNGRIESDLQALAGASARGLPNLEQTARALTVARTQPVGGRIMSIVRKPLLATALGAAVVAAILVCPVPYTRTVAYQL